MTDPSPQETALMDLIVVDDDAADAKAVRRSFQKSRIANPVIHVQSGEAALSLLRAETAAPPEKYILLVDVKMPRMTGIELLAEIREDPRLCKVVAFMLSTSSDDRDISAAYALNVAGYIRKDRVGEDFADLIRTLGGYWQISELPNMAGELRE